MRALDTKLLRDLRRLAGQALTIALVVAAGVAAFLASRSTWDTLLEARTAWYTEGRLPHVFARVERAPDRVAAQLASIPGVRTVAPRIRVSVQIPLPTAGQPPVGEIVGLPPDGAAALDRIRLAAGRLPAGPDEAVLLELFAEKWELAPGDGLPVVMNGRRRELRIVGLANAPSYVFATSAGSMSPDSSRLAVLWMDERELAPAWQLEGAFNDVGLSLHPGTRVPAVLGAVDRVLAPWGGDGAFSRDDHPSDSFVRQELEQLRMMATWVPAIFLSVAVFLLNVVLARLVTLQRPEIATLKALGYGRAAIGRHFLGLAAVIVLAGVAMGLGLGVWLGQGMTEMYRPYFKFPTLRWHLSGLDVALAAAGSLAAGLGGALGAVRAVLALAPAEAMQPPAPPTYRRSWIDGLPVERLFGQAGRMVLREVQRRPLRLLLSSVAVSFAVAILVLGRFSTDAIDQLVERQFQAGWREELTVSFLRPVPDGALASIRAVEGVRTVEGLRVVGARLRHGSRWREVPLIGHPEEGELRRVVGARGQPVPVGAGLLLTEKLAEVLEIRPGEDLVVELREGDRRRLVLPVVGTVDEALGLSAHLTRAALHRVVGEAPAFNQALLRFDPWARGEVLAALRRSPVVADLALTGALVARFRRQVDEVVGTMTVALTLFASTIAVGVVYNNARVALSVRARELASLRVLGFTRAEVSGILLGELSLQVLIGVPLGLWLGGRMARAFAATVDPERYRLPDEVTTQTAAFAAAVVLSAALASALLVRRRIDRLDLVAVLKTRE